MTRSVTLVVNPEARGVPGAAASRAAALAVAHGWEVRQQAAEVRGHAFLLAEEAAREGAQLVVAVGGDGTVREVAAGLADTGVPLAIAAAGSGNSSYRELFGEASWEATLAAVLDGFEARAVDLLEIERTGEFGLLGFSAGWFAQVVGLAATSSATGAARYAEAAGVAATAPAHFTASVRVDGRMLADGELGLVAVGGARVRASVFPVFPDSLMDDGLLEVLVVDATDTAGFNQLLGAVLSGAHLQQPSVHHARGRRVELHAPGGYIAELDGDLWEREIHELAITCAPGRLLVAVPADRLASKK